MSIKSLYIKSETKMSLKSFARKLVLEAKKDPEAAEVAKTWLANKNGDLNEKRSLTNKIKAEESFRASKAARKSKKDSGKKKTEDPLKAIKK